MSWFWDIVPVRRWVGKTHWQCIWRRIYIFHDNMSGGADIPLLSVFLSFSRQLHLVKRISVKARQRDGAAEAAAAKWRACVLPLRMQLCDASFGVKSRREVQPEVCGAGRQARVVRKIKENKNNEAALWVLVPCYSVDHCTLKTLMARLTHRICCCANISRGSLSFFLL